MIHIVWLPEMQKIRIQIEREEYQTSRLTPQACAISLFSHHFADDFGQSRANALPRQMTKIVEKINDVCIMKRIFEMQVEKINSSFIIHQRSYLSTDEAIYSERFQGVDAIENSSFVIFINILVLL